MKKSSGSFGSTPVAYTSPQFGGTLNIGIAFKDALMLHLSLGQALQKLNRYKMSSKAGKNAMVKLVLLGAMKKPMLMVTAS